MPACNGEAVFPCSSHEERTPDAGMQRTSSVVHELSIPLTQVRCIAAVLLLVGRGLEAPSIVACLLDVGNLPGKPQYCLAPEACALPGMRWSLAGPIG